MFWYERLGNKTSILHTERSNLKLILSRADALKDSPPHLLLRRVVHWFLRIFEVCGVVVHGAQLKCPLPVSFTQGAIVHMKRKGRHFKKTFRQDFSLSLL